MYKLWTDKQEIFEAKIQLQGTQFNKTKCRIVVEANDLNLMFNGSISDSGKCTVPIRKLRDVLSEGTRGRMKLEVIADDTFFTPWESDFQVDTSKKVEVEVLSNLDETEEPMVSIIPGSISLANPNPSTPLEVIDEKSKIDLGTADIEGWNIGPIGIQGSLGPGPCTSGINEKSSLEKQGRSSERAKHLRKDGKKAANKKTRKIAKVTTENIKQVMLAVMQNAKTEDIMHMMENWPTDKKLAVLKKANEIVKKG